MGHSRREHTHGTQLLRLDDALFELDPIRDVVQDQQASNLLEVARDQWGDRKIDQALADVRGIRGPERFREFGSAQPELVDMPSP